MVQGDKYALPIKIVTKTKGSSAPTLITNENVVRVRIRLGDSEAVWDAGSDPHEGLSYDVERERWMFPLTQEETLKMYTNVMLQVRLVFENGDIYNSEPQQQNVKGAIIREVEPDGQ